MRDRLAFTLIELLVVVSILGLLIALMLPIVGAARQNAMETECMTQVRSFATVFTAMDQGKDGYPHLGASPGIESIPPKKKVHPHWLHHGWVGERAKWKQMDNPSLSMPLAGDLSGFRLGQLYPPHLADYLFDYWINDWAGSQQHLPIGYTVFAGRNEFALELTGKTANDPLDHADQYPSNVPLMMDLTRFGKLGTGSGHQGRNFSWVVKGGKVIPSTSHGDGSSEPGGQFRMGHVAWSDGSTVAVPADEWQTEKLFHGAWHLMPSR